MRPLEIVISSEPSPDEVQYLEDRRHEFNAVETGITDVARLAIRHRGRNVGSREPRPNPQM